MRPHETRAMDLIVGATGSLGKRIALRLRREGRGVRALVRGDPERPEVKELAAAGVQIEHGDLARPATLGPACAGIEAVVCSAIPRATEAEHEDALRRVALEGTLALIEAAERAAVRRFVYVSYSGSLRIESPFESAKRACEARLLSGTMEAVILRPSFFMEAWLSPALGFDPVEGSARIYGSGEAKVNYVSARDVAEFAVVTTRSAEPGPTVLEIGGPEPLSQLEAVRVFEDTLQRRFRLHHVPLEDLRRRYASPNPWDKTVAALLIAYAQGDVIPDAAANAERCGIRLRSVAEYAESFAPPPDSGLTRA